MSIGAPAVEVADNRHALGIGGPNGKVSARTPRRARGFATDWVCPELFVCAEMRAFTEEVDVLFRKHGSNLASTMPVATHA